MINVLIGGFIGALMVVILEVIAVYLLIIKDKREEKDNYAG